MTLVIGDCAQRWHVPSVAPAKLTVADWRSHWPAVLPMPHPSPRNNFWLKINPWFVADVVPALQERVAKVLSRRFDPPRLEHLAAGATGAVMDFHRALPVRPDAPP